jgi:hypothetical protein
LFLQLVVSLVRLRASSDRGRSVQLAQLVQLGQLAEVAQLVVV